MIFDRVAHTQWMNENALRMFPLDDGATGIDENGVSLPTGILVDLSVTAPDVGRLHIRELRLAAGFVTVQISSDSAPALVGTYALSALKPFTTRRMTSVTEGYDGWIAFGDLSSATPSRHVFSDPAASALHPSATRISPALPVRSIGLYSDPASTLVGDVRIDGIAGTVFLHDGESDFSITLTPDAGRRVLGPCASAGPARCLSIPVRSVSGVCADMNGVLHIEVE